MWRSGGGHWVALVGWQSGAFKCGPRDRWLGWHRSVRFRRRQPGRGRLPVRARHAPANNATMNNIAIVRHRGFRFVPEAIDHFSMRRADAFDAVLSPD